MSRVYPVGRWYVGTECGQRVWRLRSWRHRPLRRHPSPTCWAFGPIMWWRES